MKQILILLITTFGITTFTDCSKGNAITKIQAEGIIQKRIGENFKINKYLTIDKKWGWIFFYEANDTSVKIYGNTPLLIERIGGKGFRTWPGELEESINRYEKTGNPCPSGKFCKQ